MKPLSAAMYVHPWDFVDEGPETVLGRLENIGISTVKLATSYHGGRYFLPHNPKRKFYYAEEGAVYFSPHDEYYGLTPFKPHRSEEYGDIDVLKLLTQHASPYGINENSWTVVFHNSLLGRMHPEFAVVNLHGDIEFNSICPNSHQARNYLIALLKDLASNYDLNAIELESASFPWGPYHGEHHEMIGVNIDPLASEFLVSCFCNRCFEKASNMGIDLEAMRKVGRRIVETATKIPYQDIPEEERLRNCYCVSNDIKEVRQLLQFKRAITDEIFTLARETVSNVNPKIRLHALVQGVFPLSTGVVSRGSEGVDLATIKSHVHGVDLVVFVSDPRLVFYNVLWSKFELGDLPLYASIRTNYPIAHSRPIIEDEITNALDAGADGIGFHSYGMTPLENLEAIKSGLARAGAIKH